jgi:hypothetical protein
LKVKAQHAKALIFIVAVTMAFFLFAPTASASENSQASWTFALFINGDNSLEQYWGKYSLPWLEEVPPSNQVNIVALVSLESSSRTLVEQIKGSSVIVVANYSKMDMGIPATVSWWISNSTALFPSTHYALTIWDHGYGWIYVSVDDVSGHSLNMPQLQSAIADAGKRIDVLGFDACMMANAEVVYQVAQTNLVSYVVASEELVPDRGFPYDKMLTKLVNSPEMLPKDFSMAMVDGWGEYYSTQSWANTVNLAAIDVGQMKSTIGTFTNWSRNMLSLLSSYKRMYTSALKSSYTVSETHYFVDAYDYGANLLTINRVTDTGLRTTTQSMQSAILTYVLKVWNGPKMTMCKGITIFWGTGIYWSSYSADYNLTAFSADTGWGNFLTAYNARA